MIKNMEKEKILDYAQLVTYQEGQVSSRTLVQNKSVGITLFAFWKGGEISPHKSEGDALVVILEGNAKITVAEQEFLLTGGQSLVMPAGKPHSLKAEENFKMSLTVVF